MAPNPRILKRVGSMNDGESARVAVITGATGGVGAAVARELSRAGYSLVLTAPSMEKLTALAAQLKGPCTVIEGSLGNEDLAETLLYAALDRFGRDAGQRLTGRHDVEVVVRSDLEGHQRLVSHLAVLRGQTHFRVKAV